MTTREFVFRVKEAPERRVVVTFYTSTITRNLHGNEIQLVVDESTTLNIDGKDIKVTNMERYRDGGTTYLHTERDGVIRIAQRTFERREKDVDTWTVVNGDVTTVYTLEEESCTKLLKYAVGLE